MLIEDLTKRKGGSLASKSFKPWSRKVTSTWKTPAMTPLKKLSGDSLSTGPKKGSNVAPVPGQGSVSGPTLTKPVAPNGVTTTIEPPKITRPKPAEPGKIEPQPIILPSLKPEIDMPNASLPKVDRPQLGPNNLPPVTRPSFGGVATDIPDPGQAWELYQQQQKKNVKKDPYNTDKWDKDITDQDYPPDSEEELPYSYDLIPQGDTGVQTTPDDSLQIDQVAYWLDKTSPFSLRKEGDGFILYNKDNALYPEKLFSNKSDAEFEMAKEIKKYLEKQGFIGGPQNLKPLPPTNKIPQQTDLVPEKPNGLNQTKPLPKDEKQDLLNNFDNEQVKELQQSFTSTLKNYLTKLQTLKQQDNPKQSDIDLYTKAIDKIRQKLKEIDNILSTDKEEDKELTIDEKIKDLGDKLFDKDNKNTYNQEIAENLLQALESKYDLSGLGVLPTLYSIESSGGTDVTDGMDQGDSVGGLQANINGSFADWKKYVDPNIEWNDVVNDHGKAMEIGAWYYRRLLNYTNNVSTNWDSISTGEITFVDKNGEEFDKVNVGDVPIELVYAAIYYNGGYSGIDKDTGIVTVPLSTADLDKEKVKAKPYIPRYEYAVKFINRYPK